MADRQAMISVRDLYKSFDGKQVLTGVNLDVEEGTTCVILGGSGSGKTVLMKHIIGLLKPDSGQVFVDGEDVVPLDDLEMERVRRKFGMVFQGAALFDSMTVYENVAFPLREHAKLSEAEMRKRVGLARAIVRDPKIVLYDEPTTGLDPITTDYVDEMILTAKAKLGVTSLVISHDVASAFKVADQIAFLAEGRIVAHAPPAEVRRSTHPAVKLFLSTWFGKN